MRRDVRPSSEARHFVKAHACGNDFLLLEAAGRRSAGQSGGSSPGAVAQLAREVCDRHRGVGADGLIVVRETPEGADTELYNADGSRPEVSGNGVRCVAAWLAARRLLNPGASITVGTGAGPKMLTLLSGNGQAYTFRADMGQPEGVREERLDVDGTMVAAVVLRVGNPQCVVLGPATEARLRTIAARLATHPAFPDGTNVELAAVESADRVRILIWERGVGPTESSGTGACAAAVAAITFGGAGRTLDVVSPGGTQRVEWSDRLWLTGTAVLVAAVDWWA
jgi:diaminopimelate epimerase